MKKRQKKFSPEENRTFNHFLEYPYEPRLLPQIFFLFHICESWKLLTDLFPLMRFLGKAIQ
jgi:hypothetical protein